MSHERMLEDIAERAFWRRQAGFQTDPLWSAEMLKNDADAKIVSMHEGARAVGWIEAMEEVAGIIAEMCRMRRIAGLHEGTYSDGLNDLLDRMQARMAERRKI